MTEVGKVVRFPLLRVLPEREAAAHEAVPDVRVVLQIAEAFQLDMPAADLRERAEAAVAGFVEANVPPERGARRDAALRSLLLDYDSRATAAREVSDEAWAAAETAQARVADLSQRRGDAGLEVLQRRADEMATEAARLALEAYGLSLEASAAATVVSMARRGETWRPAAERDAAGDEWWLPPSPRGSLSRAGRTAG
ncbi:hypothetical protein [Roseomonas mucosa]|uniref:hypothetical protein n=1 Tax=Roseomonas mucosa TaxID=207340 RepID=UPI0028CD3B4C|nr:hypothetical protein [Roseomonas mucosa]MDT8362884.1 hypothetical protein [Roseomonas mucosa]